MQNKGAIRLFAIALALVSIYSLWFTVETSLVEKAAKEYAAGDLEKEKFYLDSIAGEKVGILGKTYSENKEKEINLGLDLKGGMNVTLEVSVVDIIKSLANNSEDSTFVAAIKKTRELQKNSQDDFVTLFGEAFSLVDPNAQLAAIFNTVEMKDKITFNSTNEEVLEVLKTETQGAIDNSFNVLRTRIDRFGVSQPNIQQLETSGRILVELPGIKDPERVRKLLQGTAQLEFWETYENQEAYQFLANADKKLKEIEDAKLALAKSEEPVVETEEEVKEEIAEIVEEETDSTETLSLLDQMESDTTETDSAKTATPEALNRNYPLFAKLSPWTSRDGKLLGGPVVGVSHIKDTSAVNTYLAMPQIKTLFPKNIKFRWTIKAYDKEGNFYQLVALKITTRDNRAPLDGDAITDARAEFGNTGGAAQVSMSMNGDGAKTWARITKDNIGKSVAIVLDEYVYSFPTVQSEIKGGSSQISGNFTVNEAKDLANVLKSGKLPAPARIIQEEVVGPSLGKESVNAGLISFIIAFCLVLLYVWFYYNTAGLVANIALITNVFFVFGVLASLGAVLTLPGIAGIVLTLGMAVDANVIIYERIREELRAGKGLKMAIHDGYKNAYSAIIDGNVTTLLTGIVLFVFGSGPIQGFATTLIIGILTSLFTAIFISRFVFESILSKKKTIAFDTSLTRKWFTNMNINFIGLRKKLYIVSALVITMGIVSLATKGLNMGVDFTGGRTYIARFDTDVKTVEVRKLLSDEFGQNTDVKTFGSDNQIKITTKYMVDETELNADSIIVAKMYNALKGIYTTEVSIEDFSTDNAEIGIMSSQKVGPTIADDIKVSALISILLALIGVFIYIAIRFKKWQWGLGGVVALFHDTLIVISMYSIFYGILPFNMEIDQAFIAAILTVIGYSINDSVIIFDRIREYQTNYSKRKLEDNINGAVNSTLGRTFNTSMTTFVVLLTIFIFGGEVVRGFTFALLLGVVVGTYSSLFTATPIAYDALKRSSKKALKAEKK